MPKQAKKKKKKPGPDARQKRALAKKKKEVNALRNNKKKSKPRPKKKTKKKKPRWNIKTDWNARGGAYPPGSCSPEDLCAYLSELSLWLQQHYERALLERDAICNLESWHYNGFGLSQPVLCRNDGTDPPGEEPPPDWGLD